MMLPWLLHEYKGNLKVNLSFKFDGNVTSIERERENKNYATRCVCVCLTVVVVYVWEIYVADSLVSCQAPQTRGEERY